MFLFWECDGRKNYLANYNYTLNLIFRELLNTLNVFPFSKQKNNFKSRHFTNVI